MPKIMVVDDYQDILNFVSLKLTHSGYEVTTVAESSLCMKRLKEFKPDLVLMDIMMPGITGLELCKAIKADPEYNKTLIVFLTAKDKDFAREKAQEAGGDGFITKPFSPAFLLSEVERILGITPAAGK